MSDRPNTSGDQRPLQHNTEPLKRVKVPRCRRCGRRAPWCVCMESDYEDMPDSDEEVAP